MKHHRHHELIELLSSAWLNEPDINLLQFIQQLADEAGYQQPLAQLSDDTLIYQLKMRDADEDAVIPGLKKDYEDDFKTALLRARGVIKE